MVPPEKVEATVYPDSMAWAMGGNRVGVRGNDSPAGEGSGEGGALSRLMTRYSVMRREPQLQKRAGSTIPCVVAHAVLVLARRAGHGFGVEQALLFEKRLAQAVRPSVP
jgi:hypothetical protein